MRRAAGSVKGRVPARESPARKSGPDGRSISLVTTARTAAKSYGFGSAGASAKAADNPACTCPVAQGRRGCFCDAAPPPPASSPGPRSTRQGCALQWTLLDEGKGARHRVRRTDGLAPQLRQPGSHHHGDERLVFEYQDAWHGWHDSPFVKGLHINTPAYVYLVVSQGWGSGGIRGAYSRAYCRGRQFRPADADPVRHQLRPTAGRRRRGPVHGQSRCHGGRLDRAHDGCAQGRPGRAHPIAGRRDGRARVPADR